MEFPPQRFSHSVVTLFEGAMIMSIRIIESITILLLNELVVKIFDKPISGYQYAGRSRAISRRKSGV